MKDFDSLVMKVLSRDFPSIAAPPNAWLAFNEYCEFLADSPDRVIELVSSDYQDLTERVDQNKIANSVLVEQLTEFEQLFRFLNVKFGVPQLVKASGNFKIEYLPPDCDLPNLSLQTDLEKYFEFEKYIVTGWVYSDRVLIAHFGFVNPDDQVQSTVSISTLKHKA